jgi:hypothetical protein
MLRSLRSPRPGSYFPPRRRSQRTPSANRGRQTSLWTPKASAISSHHRLLRANRRLTCDETNELHMLGRGKHGCPVVLAAGGRGPILVVSRRSGTGVNQGSSCIHRDQFGQNHEIGEGAYPAEDVGVDRTAGAATGNTCQRVQWS